MADDDETEELLEEDEQSADNQDNTDKLDTDKLVPGQSWYIFFFIVDCVHDCSSLIT